MTNSVIVTFCSTLIAGFFGSITSYSLAKIKFKFNFNRILLIWILFTRIIPPVVMLMPYFIIIRNLGLLNTRMSLILTYTYLAFPFVVWMMLGFFKEIPQDIDDAAIIDGCNFWNRFIRIGLPLAKTGFIVVCIFVFISAWNEFLFALTLTSLKAETLPVLIGSFINDKGYEWGKIMVLSVYSIIPMLIFAIATQKFLIKGLTLGAVKE